MARLNLAGSKERAVVSSVMRLNVAALFKGQPQIVMRIDVGGPSGRDEVLERRDSALDIIREPASRSQVRVRLPVVRPQSDGRLKF